MSDSLIISGTFDPPHVKHFWILKILSDLHWIKSISIVPALQNPNKNWSPLFSYDIRIKMLEETIKEFGKGNNNIMTKINFDLFFKSKNEPSFIVDYLDYDHCHDRDIWVYVPINFFQWPRADDLIKKGVNFITIIHQNDNPDFNKYLKIFAYPHKKILFIKEEFNFEDISSTLIRDCIEKHDLSNLIRSSVCSFVWDHINDRLPCKYAL